VFRNVSSGEFFASDGVARRGSKFRDRLKALKRKAAAENMQVYFLTLTLSTSHMDVESAQLNRFLSWLRGRFQAHGGKLYYAWVLEYQMRRYVQYGDLVRHWHIAIAVPLGWLPDVKYVPHAVRHYQVQSEGLVVRSIELFKRWGLGQVLCVKARGNLAAYLGKYLEKNLGGGDYGSRMFSSSVFRWWSFPAWAFSVVQECFVGGLDIVRAVLGRGEDGRELQLSVTDGRELNSMVIRSPWRLVECGIVWGGASGSEAIF